MSYEARVQRQPEAIPVSIRGMAFALGAKFNTCKCNCIQDNTGVHLCIKAGISHKRSMCAANGDLLPFSLDKGGGGWGAFSHLTSYRQRVVKGSPDVASDEEADCLLNRTLQPHQHCPSRSPRQTAEAPDPPLPGILFPRNKILVLETFGKCKTFLQSRVLGKKIHDCSVSLVTPRALPSANYSVRFGLVKNEFCPISVLKNIQAAKRNLHHSSWQRAVDLTNPACKTNQYCNHQSSQSNATLGSINTVSSTNDNCMIEVFNTAEILLFPDNVSN